MVSWTCLDMACGDTDRFRLRLANSASILKILFSFQLPLYFGNSCWAWIKKKKKNLRPNKGIIWRGCASLPPYTTSLKPWTCIRERSSSWKQGCVTSFYMNFAYYYLTQQLNQELASFFSFKSVCLSAVSILPASLVILWALAKERSLFYPWLPGLQSDCTT